MTNPNKRTMNALISNTSKAPSALPQADTAEQAKVALKFAKVLHEWLTPAQMRMVVARNEGMHHDDPCCSSHDFCDANMAMDEAMQACGHSTDGDPDEMGWNVVWNGAWAIAKRMNFDTVLLNAYAQSF